MTEQLTRLLAELQNEFPRLEISRSGTFVDLRYFERFLTIEETEEGIGISELNGGAEDWLGGHQHCSCNIEGAQRFLNKLLLD